MVGWRGSEVEIESHGWYVRIRNVFTCGSSIDQLEPPVGERLGGHLVANQMTDRGKMTEDLPIPCQKV